ncbi:MAG: hypothetical protein D6741_07990 [Planctomycetota bacterium]|nr:MAG: hypothetical protein D6741_07990 [Planctomycetota bacterium]
MKRTLPLFSAVLVFVFAAAARAHEGYPDFDWDRVPLYAHLSIGNGLTAEQYAFLADHYDLIAFQAGGRIDGPIEPKIAAGARAIKKRNPRAKVLFYWSCDLMKRPWRLSNAAFPSDGRLTVAETRSDGVYFDVSRTDVRTWWSDVAARAVHEYGCDGIFVDGAGTATIKWRRVTDADKVAALQEGLSAMLIEARKKMGPQAIIIFNPLHGDDGKHGPLGEQLLSITDGAMMDDFDRAPEVRDPGKEYLAAEIEEMRKAANMGKIVVFKGWPGFTWWSDPELLKKPHDELHRIAAERISFPLACYLVGAGRYSYFCYTWGWLGEHGTFDRYPEFEKPLGPPKGEATRDGWTYRREFEHASVFVDLEHKTARIEWR